MSEQLRLSVFVDGPNGEETQVLDEIPRIVRSDPGALTIQAGGACVTFSDADALMALVAAAQ